jgi:hypothetical protein
MKPDRHLAQLIRRNMITKVKPSAKVYKRAKHKLGKTGENN